MEKAFERKRSGRSILCVILVITILITGNVLTIGAAVDAISEATQKVRDIETLMNSLGDYINFTEAEKRRVNEYIRGMVEDTPQPTYADSVSDIPAGYDAIDKTGAEYQTVVKSRGTDEGVVVASGNKYQKTFSEVMLSEMRESHNLYSECVEEEYVYLMNYLAVRDDKEEVVKGLFEYFESEGYGLYESVQIIKIYGYGILTLEEAIEVYGVYPLRFERDKEALAFLDFALNFDIRERVEEGKLHNIEYTYSPYAGESEYTSESAFEEAKEYFLGGYPSDNIRSAYIVSKAIECAPDDIIKASVEKSVGLLKEESDFQDKYNVDVSAVKAELSVSSGMQAGISSFRSVSQEFEELEAAAEESSIVYSAGSGNQGLQPKPSIPENVSAPYTLNMGENGGASLNSGSATYSKSLFSLPGVNGMDINLSISYDSSRSNTKTPDIYQINDGGEFDYPVYDSYYDKDGMEIFYMSGVEIHRVDEYNLYNETVNNSFTQGYFNIGAGWIYDLPYFFTPYPCFDNVENLLYKPSLYIPGEGILQVTKNSDSTYTRPLSKLS